MVEAEEAVKRNLSVKTVKLQGVTAGSPDLEQVKEILNKAKNVVNSREIRVDFHFIPVGTTMMEVQLVGYSENVNQLEKVLCDYQTNQAPTQDSLNFPHPELVDCLDEDLVLIGLKHLKVTLKTSTTPNPCVLPSDNRCHMDEVKQALIPALSDTLVLDGPGARQYFQADGKISKELIENSCEVLIKEHPGVNSDERSCLTPVENIAANQANLQIKFGSLEDQQLNSPEVGKNLVTTNDITLMVVPGVRLHVVFGDITHETTDAIVNSTNFEHLDYGVCKAILTAAGRAVKAKVKAAKVTRGSFFKTKGGSLPCKAILHVCGLKDAGLIESLVHDLILHCESSGYRSIAIPAICAGRGGMDAGVVAQAILRGVKTAASSTPLRCVTDIRLILIDNIVFLLFKEEALKVFSTDVVDRVSLPHEKPNPQRFGNENPSILSTSFETQKSVFLIQGLCGKNISDAKMQLKQLYQDQCLTHTFTAEEVGSLSEDDIMCLQQLVDKEGLEIQSVQGNMTVSGLKDGVNSVMQRIKESECSNLRRKVIVTEEEALHSLVAWCIMGRSGNWERLPKTANHRLEQKNLEGGIMDEQSNQWTVDLQRMEATGQVTREIRKIKRLENRLDFTLPLYWDNMAAGENMKVVTLQESSPEYRSVEQAFRRSVPEGRIKIKRIQNVHLRLSYEALKKCISDKNAQMRTKVEKVLYHGTTKDNCDAIKKAGFNRRLAGQNATQFGEGTYFAVNASYSAQPKYAKPAIDGSRRLIVAQVLTGIYTVGKSDMKMPPPRDRLLPPDRYDSLVDRMKNPSMHVVFHDNQAYPDYLITILGKQAETKRRLLRVVSLLPVANRIPKNKMLRQKTAAK
ncbi:protein mono-ADP-ribosyltransferase PARP14 [Pleuronectes platessa]|uniref:protein mono-ADP-ribosyltransferase PARP14 n=1 Tax=Pleuronectes platessa TaxID=8262 RepID=UPI00232A41AF|nr:protein mono-ADP-ribosyltransferase PARP14 [Pleuronectes platessa]